jgi:O-antigen/teichoic acid export membrane protein
VLRDPATYRPLPRRSSPRLRGRLGGRLGRDTLWASATEGLTLLAQLVTFFALSRTLGPREYGFYAGIQGIDAILTTLLLTWTSMVVMQELVAPRGDKGTMMGSVLSWGALSSAIALIASLIMGTLLVPELDNWIIVAFVAADAVGAALMGFAAAILQAEFSYTASAPPRNYLVLGKMLAVVGLWAAGSVTLAWVAVTQLAVALAVGLGSLWWAYRKVGRRVRLSRPRLRDLRLGGLYAVGLGALSVQEDSDKTLLVTYGHATAGGQYAASYRIVQIAFLPLRALLNASHQDFLRPSDEPNAHVKRALKFTLPSVGYGVCIAAILVVLAPIPAWLLGDGYSSATGMIRLLAPLIFLRAISLFPINALLGLSRNGARTAVLIIGAAVNLALNCTLIPRLSWIGAAVGTIASELALGVTAWIALVLLQRSADRKRFCPGNPAATSMRDTATPDVGADPTGDDQIQAPTAQIA